MATTWWRTIKPITQFVVSMAILSAALYIILSGKYSEDHVNWAFGIIGLIVGLWLR